MIAERRKLFFFLNFCRDLASMACSLSLPVVNCSFFLFFWGRDQMFQGLQRVMNSFQLLCRDLALAPETCEELFTPAAPHIFLALSGIEVFSNGSGSHHQVRPFLFFFSSHLFFFSQSFFYFFCPLCCVFIFFRCHPLLGSQRH